jgi:pectate lyase
MRRKQKFLEKIVPLIILIGVFVFLNGCKKGLENPVPAKVKTPVEIRAGLFAIDFDGLRSDGGYAWKIGYVIDGGDSNEKPSASLLRIFENGVELHPPHSPHQDIRDFGKGRFSHWGTTLYFSTTDNTDPVANGREYAYTLDGSGYPAAKN